MLHRMLGDNYVPCGENHDSQVQATSGAGNTVQTINAPSGNARGVILSARTGNAYVVFDPTMTPAAGLGLEIVAGAQPVFIPVRPFGASPSGTKPPVPTIKYIGSAANTILNVLWVS